MIRQTLYHWPTGGGRREITIEIAAPQLRSTDSDTFRCDGRVVDLHPDPEPVRGESEDPLGALLAAIHQALVVVETHPEFREGRITRYDDRSDARHPHLFELEPPMSTRVTAMASTPRIDRS